MLLVDPPASWQSKGAALNGIDGLMTRIENAAAFFPA